MQKNAKKIELQFWLGLTYIDWNLGAKNPNFPKFMPKKPISAKKLELQFCLDLTYSDWDLEAKTPHFPKFRSQKSISALNWVAEF